LLNRKRGKVREKKIFRIFLICLLITGLHWQLVKAENYYGMPNDYLQYGAGARSLAMGGAYVGLADEASAPYWNPAGLTQIEEHQFLSMYAPFFEGVSHNFVSYVHPLRSWGNLAISDIFLYSGGYEEVDEAGNVLDTNQSIFMNSVIFSYAGRIFRQLSLGANLKLVHERVMRYSGNSQGIDLGLLYKPVDELSIGLVVQNVLQPKVTLIDDPNVYDTNVKGGVAFNTYYNRLTLTADINKLVNEKAYFSAGLEISPWEEATFSSLKRLDLRAGVNHLQSFTCGIGLKINFLSMDYAFNIHKMGNLHRFGLTFRWGSIYKARARPVLESGNIYWVGPSREPLKFIIEMPSTAINKWTLKISDEEGKVVRAFGTTRRKPKIIRWNIRNQKGKLVKDGYYYYEFTVIYKNGRKWIDRGEIRLLYEK